jgi:hypothetical protein
MARFMKQTLWLSSEAEEKHSVIKRLFLPHHGPLVRNPSRVQFIQATNLLARPKGRYEHTNPTLDQGYDHRVLVFLTDGRFIASL